MQCHELAERLTDFLEGDLTAPEEAAALEHLSTCSHCETVLADTKAVRAMTTEHGRVELSDADRDRMLGSLLDEAASAHPGQSEAD